MNEMMGYISDALATSPFSNAIKVILAVLFIVAAGYLAFGQDHGRGLPLLRVVGGLMLLVVGYTVLSVLGFQLHF